MKGLALILTLLIVSVAIVIVSGSASIFVAEIASSKQIDLSTVAFYIADSGIEAALYAERICNPRRNGNTCPGGPTTVAGLEIIPPNVDDCRADGDGIIEPGNNENNDTCLDRLDNLGWYSYTVVNNVGDPRDVTSTGQLRSTKRSIQVEY